MCTNLYSPAEKRDGHDSEFKTMLAVWSLEEFLPLTVTFKNVSDFDNHSNITSPLLVHISDRNVTFPFLEKKKKRILELGERYNKITSFTSFHFQRKKLPCKRVKYFIAKVRMRLYSCSYILPSLKLELNVFVSFL